MSTVNTILVMGVSCTGKTTRGDFIAYLLGLWMVEGDDLHPQKNIDKMTRGEPLNDEDRRPWLENIPDSVKRFDEAGGTVFTCSALKKSYRDILRSGLPSLVTVFLEISKPEALKRSGARPGHFAGPNIMDDQFADLEPPTESECRLNDNLIIVPENVMMELPDSLKDLARLPNDIGSMSNEFEAAVTALYVVNELQERGLSPSGPLPTAAQICRELAFPIAA